MHKKVGVRPFSLFSLFLNFSFFHTKVGVMPFSLFLLFFFFQFIFFFSFLPFFFFFFFLLSFFFSFIFLFIIRRIGSRSRSRSRSGFWFSGFGSIFLFFVVVHGFRTHGFDTERARLAGVEFQCTRLSRTRLPHRTFKTCWGGISAQHVQD